MTDQVKILHAADFHLDSSFAGLAPQRAAERRSEQRELLSAVFELANKQGVQALLLAGDLLDSDNAYFETTDLLRKLCAESEARIFIAPGNHDYFSQGSPYGAMVWPDNVHIFRSPRISAVEVPELNLRVYGAGFTKPSSAPLLEGFAAIDDGMTSVMVIHGERGGVGTYNQISDDQIISSGLDYLALGHTHGYSGISRLGGTFFAYPGCPEGRGFDELGEKGVIIGTVQKGNADLHFTPMSRRMYQIKEISLTGVQNQLEAISSALPEDTHPDIYRLILKGETNDIPQTDELYKALEPRFYGLEIKDKTTRLISLWDGDEEQTLRGEFLTRLKRRWNQAKDDKEKEQIELAVRFGLAALDRREAPGQ